MRSYGLVCHVGGVGFSLRITKKTKITKIRYSSESSRGCGFCGKFKNSFLSMTFLSVSQLFFVYYPWKSFG